jgi:sugar O-acyltransferase (sialic acid O-acetyltransferase NeuD family)
MNKTPVILLGCGGHAKVILETLLDNNIKIIGATDISLDNDFVFSDIPIIGNDDVIFNYDSSEICLVNGIGMLPGSTTRMKLNDKFYSQGYIFGTVIDKFTKVSKSAFLSEGVQLMSGVIIQSDVSIGINTIINTSVSIDHDCKIGANCHISPGAVLCGGIDVGNNTFIGPGTVVTQGVKIGRDCVIGAGSVLVKDVNDGNKIIQQ